MVDIDKLELYNQRLEVKYIILWYLTHSLQPSHITVTLEAIFCTQPGYTALSTIVIYSADPRDR